MSKTKLIFCLLAFLGLFSPMLVKATNIHILLEKNAHEALLEVRGPYYLYDPSNDYKIASGLLAKRFLVRATQDGLKWGQEFIGLHQLRVIPRNPETAILLNGIQYHGAITIYKIGTNLKVVNEIDVEDYLKSILSDHFSFPQENEALNATAIVARTNAYFQIVQNKNSYWHIDRQSSNYIGAALIIPDSPIVAAVDATRDLILVNPDVQNQPFAALWTEHSAGKTASYEAIFRKDLGAPKTGVDVPLASLDRKETSWSYSITKDKLANLLGLSKINKVELFQEKASGKVYGLRFKDETESRDLDFFALQTKLSKKLIPSNDFTVENKGSELLFKGFGKGHGVGLCLYAAAQMAQNGENAVKILSKFFPGTYIVNLAAYPLNLTPDAKLMVKRMNFNPSKKLK